MYCGKLEKEGKIPKEIAAEKIKKAYIAILDNYPESKFITKAGLQLGRMLTFERNWADAAGYFDIAIQESIEKNEYTKFSLILSLLGDCYTKLVEPEIAAEIYISYLPLADPNDSYTGIVRAKLQDLKGGVR